MPIKFYSYCHKCSKERASQTREEPIHKFNVWIQDHKDEAQFNSRESALNTVMTVAVQGFCAGQAMYNPQEQFHLRVMAREAKPMCFWSGAQLSITARCPKNKFTVDRTIFHQNKALRYGAEDQILVAASQFANCFFMNRTVDERIQHLDSIEQEWEAGLEWADRAIEELRSGFDEKKEWAWTAEWTTRWSDFVKGKVHRDRVAWSKSQWRFFHEVCQGRSLVTGQPIAKQDANIDRVFNDDTYTLTNCILIDRGLNFAKRTMAEFQTSDGFEGTCKLRYGVEILRAAVRELLDSSRPRRAM
ncbi:hypothetical protein BGZ67_009562 [Mortierella alpina]|nr:hypothetical protein BGZ67_009562 [Mortierella alpina]